MTGVLLLINGFFILLLLLAYAAYHIPPATIPYLPFAGLAYPYILLANLLFVLFWIVKRIKFALIPLLFILLGWNHIGRLFQLNGKATGDEAGIKVVSYNIQNFIKYNTSTTKYLSDFENQDRITDWLTQQNADIVCLQEMLYDRDNYDQFAAQLGNHIGCPNNYHENYYKTSRDKLDAIAIFTRFPILNTGHLEYDDKSIGIYADLVINHDTVRLYNLHLASIHFRKEDYEFITGFSPQQEQEEIKTGTLQIIAKMRVAFEKRALQSKIIEKELELSPYPTIICGDFNDTPHSYSYHRLTRKLIDAFVVSGKGIGTTYAGENFPAFRIDYILYDPMFTASGFIRHKINLSDHYPISCTLHTRSSNN
ncbi:MAG: endonuclease/exonuclease/phosphatase family protein [Bacteroidetes bacterium]|nr:endonuclease/exonuclease/phosphatase family protein [Bacteroidota bacterium]